MKTSKTGDGREWRSPVVHPSGTPESWVVTVCDHRFFPWMAAFVGSLLDVARFRGNIGVIDTGLTEAQQEMLTSAGITLFPPRGELAPVIDRYVTIAELFAGRQNCLVAHFDADIWFAGPLDGLFGDLDLRSGKLGAAIDVATCDYYFKCSQPERHPEIEKMLADVCARYGEAMQAGVIVGTPGAWSRYAEQARLLFSEGWIRRGWGSDALALNFLASHQPAAFTQLPITWNAPPEWPIKRSGNLLFHEREGADPLPIVAVHRTTGVRNRPELDIPMQSVYPEIVRRWAKTWKVKKLP